MAATSGDRADASSSTPGRADEVGTMRDRDWVLWDGDCGFCRRGVYWFAERDTAGRMEMIPYQEAPSPPMTPELARACDRALYVVHPDGSMTAAGRAILYMLGQIGYTHTARILAWPPLVWLIEIGYWIVARNRHVVSRFLFTRERATPTRGSHPERPAGSAPDASRPS